MFVLVVGGGKVGYYLSKELIESGHEVVLMEKDRARAAQIVDELGSIVVPHDGCEGKYLGEAGSNRADIVAAVTGDDEDNLVICQMASTTSTGLGPSPGSTIPRTRICSGTSASTRSSARPEWPSARSSRTSRCTSCFTS